MKEYKQALKDRLKELKDNWEFPESGKIILTYDIESKTLVSRYVQDSIQTKADEGSNGTIIP